MQPRRLRLGDVVDDYCSRCRLLSNHAIAAIVDDVIKQTRCSTCDFEHPYKDGKLPVRRAKKDGTSALYQQVLDNVTDGIPEDATSAPARPAAPIRPALARPDVPRPQPVSESPAIDIPPAVAPAPVAASAPAPVPPSVPPSVPGPTLVRAAAASAPAPAPPPVAAAPASQSDESRDDGNEGIVHRRLIRATLPKVEGAERDPRPIPVFTVHEAANARGKFRRFPRPSGQRPPGQGFGHGGGNGNQQGGNGNAMPRFGHGGQPSPFGAQGRGHGKGGGPHANRGGGQQGNRAGQQRRGNKGR
jgi:translation initiation factor IF-2